MYYIMKEKYFRVAQTISRWKLDNCFENWLGYCADKSEIWKRIYVLYYKLFDREYYVNGLRWVETAINKHNHELNDILSEDSKKVLRRDLIYSLHRFGACFDEYFIFDFYHKNAEQRSEYVTLKLQYGYCELVNSIDIRSKFEDKYICYQNLKKYYKREVILVKDEADYDVFKEFTKKFSSFIYKPLSAHSGKGIRIISDSRAAVTTEMFIDLCKSGPFVLEELIEQADSMAILHKQSINTIRISTFTCNNEVSIVAAAIRMGTGDSNVDNAGAGGIYASVEVDSGIVDSIARDNYGHYHEVHPDTKIPIKGFVIPEWDELINIVKQIAKEIDGATMISWDFAYGSKGWTVVEGNDVGEPYLLQAPHQAGRKSTIITLIDKFYNTI